MSNISAQTKISHKFLKKLICYGSPANSEKQIRQDPLTGMPILEEEQKIPLQLNYPNCTLIAGILLSYLFGFAFAQMLFSAGDTKKFEAKIKRIQDNEFQLAYYSCFAYIFLVHYLNLKPLLLKALFLDPLRSGNWNLNTWILKFAPLQNFSSKIVLSNEGHEGAMNRSSIQLMRFVEESNGLMLAVSMASFVFPKQTFFLVLVFCFAQASYASRIVSKGYSAGLLANLVKMLIHAIVSGMVLFIAFKSVSNQPQDISNKKNRS